MRYLFIILIFLLSLVPTQAHDLLSPPDIFGIKGAPEKQDQLSADAIREIKELIKTIENKPKRDQLVKGLKALTVISKVKEPQEGFLARATKTAAQKLEYAADLTVSAARAVVYFPGEFFQSILNLANPEIRQHFLDFLLKTILALGGATLLELGLVYAMKRRGFHYATHAKTLPRLCGGLMPLVIFALISLVIISFIAQAPIVESLTLMVLTIIATRLTWITSLFTASPRHQENRLLPISDEAAVRFHGWLLTIGQTIIIGVILTQVLQHLYLSEYGLQAWTRMYGFLNLIVFIGFLNDYREGISNWLRPEAQDLRESSRLIIGALSILSRIWYFLAIVMVFGAYLSWALQAFDYLIYLIQGSVLTIALVGFTITLSRYLHRSSRRWFVRLTRKTSASENPRGLWNNTLQSAHSLIPIIQVILHVLSLIGIFRIWGVDLLLLINDDTTREVVMTCVSVLIILWITRILWMAIDLIIDYQMKPLVLKGRTLEPSILIKTLGPIIRTIAHVILGITGLVFVLKQLDINVSPLLYGLGFIGVAFSFGAQNLAKDLITGVLTLLEGNVAVGEFVIIGEYTGVVEIITPRSIFLRHPNGHLQSIPFSEVSNIINKSRGFATPKIMVPVDSSTPIEKVYESLRVATACMMEHPVFGKKIQGKLNILGVGEEFDKGYTVVASIQIDPDPKGHFVYEFYRQWKVAAHEAKIDMPNYRQQIEIIRRPLA
ncbi:MAG: mechanosensitive ion channel domain-containing protein [Alphaproteobacteria bacterium]